MAKSESPIQSVGEAVEALSKLPRRQDEFLVFRGHADYAWKLNCKIARAQDRVKEREGEIARELVAVAPAQFRDDSTMFDRLVRMQHFGLPTRLLDTTSNPLVALYFACQEAEDEADGAVVLLRDELSRRKYYDSDTVSCLTNLANLSAEEKSSIEETRARTIPSFNKIQAVDRLLQFIRAEKPSFRPRIRRLDLFSRVHVIPKMNNPRIVAQSGSFVVFGLNWRKIPNFRIPIRVQRLRVAAAAKGDIRRELANLGITESALFPELDKAASYIVRRIIEGG